MSQAGDSPTRKLAPMAAGQRYGRLVAIDFVDRNRRREARWRFRCDCGQEYFAQAGDVRFGGTKSCGCLRFEQAAAMGRASATHGMHGTSGYKSWESIYQRCNNHKSKHFPRYGGRGIKVCERWKSFENFYADMGPRPSKKHSIERDDNDGDYEPTNCRWATPKEQARNRRDNRLISIDGSEITMAEAAERFGINYHALFQRLDRGWTVERALAKGEGRRKPR
jgi:hypothetical protein